MVSRAFYRAVPWLALAGSFIIPVAFTSDESESEAIFRPVAGEFPPLEKAHSYRGELTFVDPLPENYWVSEDQPC